MGFQAQVPIDKEEKIDLHKIQFSKSINLTWFWDLKIQDKIQCEKIIFYPRVEKLVFEASNRHGVNTKVVGKDEINKMKQK